LDGIAIAGDGAVIGIARSSEMVRTRRDRNHDAWRPARFQPFVKRISFHAKHGDKIVFKSGRMNPRG
jgi:hypothetical protein